jgi:hypothetical protein
MGHATTTPSIVQKELRDRRAEDHSEEAHTPPPRPGRLCRVRFYDGAFGEEADYARGLRFVRGRLGDIRDGGGGSSRMVRPVRGKHTRCKEEGARAEAALGLYT